MKWVIRLIGLATFAVAAGIGALFLIPSETLARIVSGQLSTQLGRDVTLQDVSISVFPIAGVRTEGVSVANAEWSDDGPFLQAGFARIGVDTLAMLGGSLRIRTVELHSPNILLQDSGDGSGNWEISARADSTSTDPTPLPLFTLDELIIRNGTFRYEAVGADPLEVRDIDLNLEWPDADSPASFTANVTPYGGVLTVTGHLDAPLALFDGGTVGGSLAVTGPGGGATFDGELGLAPEFGGAVTIDLNDTAAFLASLGIPDVEVPYGLGRRGTVAGDFRLNRDGLFTADTLRLDLDEHQMVANITVDTAGKPKVNARIEAGHLDFADMSSDAEPTEPTSAGWSQERLDASALAILDGEIVLMADSVTLGGLKLDASRIDMNLTNSRAVFGLNPISAYGGTATGQFVVNNRNGLSVGGKMSVEGVELNDLLRDAAGISRLSGPADLVFDFLGSGSSLHAIMNSLSGSGSLAAGPGVISGIDLDRLMQTGDGTGGTTVFKTLNGTFSMVDGVMRNDDLSLQTPLFQIAGEGTVGLGAQEIDYLFLPGVAAAREGRGITIPVGITGPWSAPSIRPRLDEAIERNLEEEKQELETKAKEVIKQKLEDGLGSKIEDKLGGGLLKLLDE
ncbi:MAG: AsmA family protein [Rhodobacteraceae bacterium]|nr:AsmA family protein [Paracoccaceae bacterium]